MFETFQINQYTVECSLNERSIYLKITDKIALLAYEGTFDSDKGNLDMKDFRLNLELSGLFEVLLKCFAQEPEYGVTFHTNAGSMKLAFHGVVGAFLQVALELLLPEKIMSYDSQLKLHFNRLEQTHADDVEQLNARIAHLETMVERLSNADMYMLPDGCNFIQQSGRLFYKMNTPEMRLTNTSWDYSRIKEFYNLQKLELNSCDDIRNLLASHLENATLAHLILRSCQGITSLTGLEKMPNLQKLELLQCSSLRDVVTVLASFRHCIQEIVIQGCNSINLTEITTFCTQQNIKLTLS